MSLSSDMSSLRFPATAKAVALAAALTVPLLALQASGSAVQHALRYERAAVLGGQLWRLFTAHALHLGWTHLLLNATGLLLCAALAPQAFQPRRLPQLLGCLAVLALAVSLGLLCFSPGLAHYVGLSGVLYGLFLWALAPLARTGDPAALLTLAGLLLWTAWQGLAGPLASEEAAIGGRIIVEAHGYGLAGAILGLGWTGWRAQARTHPSTAGA